MNLLHSFLFSALGAAVASAQAPSAPNLGAIIDRAFGTSIDGDDVTGIGPQYLLRASTDGVVFTPVLGNGAPRPLPLGLRFLDARRSGQPIAMSAARRHHAANTVHYDHGNVLERYELRADGVEQTFTFAQRPAGEGDRLVRLAVDSVVSGVADASGGIAFHEHGRGVHYGALVGVDARGARVPGNITLQGNVLELKLPAAFVDAAAYPLTFDPLIGPSGLLNTTADDGQPVACAFDAPDRWLVVWRRVVAIGEGHLVAQLVDNGFGVGAPALLDNTAGSDVAEAAIGAIPSQGVFVVAWRRVSLFGTQAPLIVRGVPVNGGAFTSSLQLSTNVRSHAISRAPAASTALPIAFITSTNIVTSQMVQHSGSGLGLIGAAFSLGTSQSPAPEVAISRSFVATAPHYLVVWTGSATSADDLGGRLLGNSGAPVNSAVQLTLGTLAKTQPAVDGNGSEFLVSWVQNDAIRVQKCTVVSTPTPLPMMNGPQTTLATGLGATTVTNGDIVLADDHYVASYQVATDLFDTSAHVAVLTPDATQVGTPTSLVGPTRPGGYTRQGVPRLAARNTVANNDDAVLVVFEEGQGAPPFDRDVVGQWFEPLGQGGAVTTIAQSCGFGGICSANGPCALGNAAFSFQMQNGDPTAPLALLSLALPTAAVPCGTCSLLPGLVLETHPLVGGSASRSFPIPTDAQFLGASIQAQWAPVFGATGPCPLFPFVTTSTILQVTIGL